MCPGCLGDGRTPVWRPSPWGNRLAEARCPDCDGSGVDRSCVGCGSRPDEQCAPECDIAGYLARHEDEREPLDLDSLAKGHVQ